MMGPRYFLAKYVPDLTRMEPRNVGVLVWTPEAVDARFLAEKPDRPGEVDGRSIPSFVTNAGAYKQWVAYWRKELDRWEIEPTRGGFAVPRSSPDFLDALAKKGRGNFLLTSAGYLLDPVGPDELPDLTAHLYGQLVATTTPEEPKDYDLDETCMRLIGQANLAADVHLKNTYPVECRLPRGGIGTFEFSYAYGNGQPLALYQRLKLSSRPKLLHKDINDSAWKFSQVLAAHVVPEDRTGVLILPTPDQRDNRAVQDALAMIGTVTRVLDLNDFARVQAEFSGLPALLSHHAGH